MLVLILFGDSELQIMERTIVRHKKLLIELMDPDFGLLDELYACGNLHKREFDAVRLSPSTAQDRCERLLDCIIEKSMVSELLSALERTNQTHLANYIRADGDYKDEFNDDWPLGENERKTMTINRRALIDIIDHDICVYLYSNDVISLRQHDFILSKLSKSEKNEALLEVMYRFSVKQFWKCVTCLHESNQSHVAAILSQSGAVVGLHANLQGSSQKADERDEIIAREMVNILHNVHVDRPILPEEWSRISSLVELKLFHARKGDSVLLYFHCLTIEELLRLDGLMVDGSLKKMIEEVFTQLLRSETTIAVSLTWSEGDFERGSLYFSARDGGRPSKSENSRIRNEVVNMYKSFVSEVDPRDVLDLLIQKRVINIERKDEVMSKVTTPDRCRALLDQLFFCSNDEAFVVLRQALNEHYHWIVERIDESMSANNEVIRSGCGQKKYPHTKIATRQLDEASRRITELEEEVNKYRRETLKLKSELSFLQVSHDEGLKRELKLKDQLASFDNRRIPTESENEEDDAFKHEVEKMTQRREGPAKRLPPTPLPKRPTGQVELSKNSMEPAPPLPPRQPIKSTELDWHSKESDELQTTCFMLKDCEIICSDLNLESLVESFPYTEIWKGKLKKSTDVSVKKLIGSERSAAEFFIEAQVLHRLKYPNIIELIGISSLERPLLIVTEYLSHDNLGDHLRKDQGNTVDLPLIIDFARQIAEGMCFVAEQGVVHRDLRAVNMLLASRKLVKISNFEIALDLQDKTKAEVESENFRFPIRWTAVDSIMSGRFTLASDVWSFGIVLYEMFTFGELPYEGMCNAEVLELLLTGYRLPPPESKNKLICPETVYQTLVRCWDKDPDARPSFQMLKNFFEKFSNDSYEIVQDTILPRPQLVTVIKGSTPVRGMAMLDGWLYVVRFDSNQVEAFEARSDFKRNKKSIIISLGQREKKKLFQRLKSPPKESYVSSGIQDIASCNHYKRLYLSDWQNMCVHCVDPVKKEVVQSWDVESGDPWGISVTAEGNVIVSLGDSRQLCEYSAEGLLLRTIRLKMVKEGPWHGLQLFGVDSWVVCHGGRHHGSGCVSVVNSEGDDATGYEEIKLDGPSHLAVLSSNHILVAEEDRIILLHPSLRGPVKEILNADHGIVNPVRIHLCESSERLVVGLVDGTVLVYRIMKVADEQSTTV